VQYTNEQLKYGMLTGDVQIYKYLKHLYMQKVVKFVRKKGGSTEDAHTVYFETVCKIYLRMREGKFDTSKGKFGGYFMKIAHDLWVDKKREQKKENVMEDSENILSLLPDSQEDDNLLNRVKILRKHIASLSDKEQRILKLFYHQNKSAGVIAKEFKSTEGYIRILLMRSREKLRELIANDPDYLLC